MANDTRENQSAAPREDARNTNNMFQRLSFVNSRDSSTFLPVQRWTTHLRVLTPHASFFRTASRLLMFSIVLWLDSRVSFRHRIPSWFPSFCFCFFFFFFFSSFSSPSFFFKKKTALKERSTSHIIIGEDGERVIILCCEPVLLSQRTTTPSLLASLPRYIERCRARVR